MCASLYYTSRRKRLKAKLPIERVRLENIKEGGSNGMGQRNQATERVKERGNEKEEEQCWCCGERDFLEWGG